MLASCARSPITGKKEFAISEKRELALGASYDPQIVASMGEYKDPGLEALINKAGMEMAKDSHRPTLDWKFTIIDSDVVNAFAVPGGYVYFTRGILAHFNNEAEFAGVLGHEIGHVTARHTAKSMVRQQLAQVGMIAGMLASQEVRNNLEAISQGMQLLFLKYGRDAETESDALGVEYSSEQGYDANYMAGFFKTIDRIQKEAGVTIPDFQSTHPNPLNREANVKQMAGEWQAKLPGAQDKVNRDSYLRLLDGLVYGEDPKQGYVENNVFYHPGLKFQYKYPKNWQLLNSPLQVQMANADGSAGAIFRLAEGTNLNTIKQEIVSNYKLNVIQEKQEKVNGLNALAFIGDVTQEDGSKIRLMTYLISYNGNTYLFHGIAAAAQFSKYSSTFQTLFESFNKLTDPNKINKQAERIKIVSVKSNGTLRQALTAAGVKSARLEELSLINGMQLTDQVKSGMLIKIVQ